MLQNVCLVLQQSYSNTREKDLKENFNRSCMAISSTQSVKSCKASSNLPKVLFKETKLPSCFHIVVFISLCHYTAFLCTEKKVLLNKDLTSFNISEWLFSFNNSGVCRQSCNNSVIQNESLVL